MKFNYGWIALLASANALVAIAQTPPPGWKFLEADHAIINAERVNPSMVTTEADFNGDGQADRAFFLMEATDRDRAGVFIFLAQDSGDFQVEKVDEFRFSEGEFALLPIRAGCYPSAGQSLCLHHDGLLRSEIEYGWTTLYWLENGIWQQIEFARGEFDGL